MKKELFIIYSRKLFNKKCQSLIEISLALAYDKLNILN